MAVRTIASTDTLESGFRSRYNETIREIITAGEILANGTLRLKKFDNSGNIDIDLTSVFTTTDDLQEFISSGLVLPTSSEETSGIIRIGTQEEVDAGESDSLAITPEKAKISSLFPLKGVWTLPGVDDPGYGIGNIVIYNKGFYSSLVDANKIEPGTDATKWEYLAGFLSSASLKIEFAGVSEYTIADWQTTFAALFGNYPSFTILQKNPDGDNANLYRKLSGINEDYTYNGALLQSVYFPLGPFAIDGLILINSK